MTNPKQPKALFLADYLENCKQEDAPAFTAAAELRRLHKLNQALIEALQLALVEIHDPVLTNQAKTAIVNAEESR